MNQARIKADKSNAGRPASPAKTAEPEKISRFSEIANVIEQFRDNEGCLIQVLHEPQ